jgi:hypothetical protein
MPDIYSVNSSNIVGGAGRLVVKPFDGTYPDSIGEVMDLTNPERLMSPWTDVGATTDGITTTRGYDSDDFEVDQRIGAVDTDITGWTHGLETNLAENTPANRKLALIGGTIVETPPTLGTATTLTAPSAINATILTVASSTDITAGSFVQISESGNSGAEMKQVNRVQGNTLYLETPLSNSYTTAASVRPVTSLGSRRMGYGTPQNIPIYTVALISQKKDGSLYMAVFRKCKVAGDDKDQTFEKGKRTIPLNMSAFPVDGVAQEENVYYEIETVVDATP